LHQNRLKFLLALARELRNYALKGLRHGAARDVACMLVELDGTKRPRGGTSTLCSSCTTEDLPMTEYPETSTSSGRPAPATRLRDPGRAAISGRGRRASQGSAAMDHAHPRIRNHQDLRLMAALLSAHKMAWPAGAPLCARADASEHMGTLCRRRSGAPMVTASITCVLGRKGGTASGTTNGYRDLP